MQGLTDLLGAIPALRRLDDAVRAGVDRQLVYGVGPSHHALVCAALSKGREPLLVVVPGEKEALTVVEDLGQLLPGRGVFLFSPWEFIPFKVLAYSKHVAANRLRVLEALARGGRNVVVVAPVDALARKVMPARALKEAILELAVGQEWDLDALRGKIVELGYEHAALVEGEGQFSSRGGIIDVFPMTMDYPVRIEFFGDEIDSLRVFDPETQRSEAHVRSLSITPVHELVMSEEEWARGYATLSGDLKSQVARLRKAGKNEAAERLEETVGETLALIEARRYFYGIEEYLDYFYPNAPSIFSYLPPGTRVVITDPERTSETAASLERQRVQGYGGLFESGQVLPRQFKVYLSWGEVRDQLRGFPIIYSSFLPQVSYLPEPEQARELVVKGIAGWPGKPEALIEDLRLWRKRGYAVGLLAGTQERARKLVQTLRRGGLEAFVNPDLDALVPGNVAVAPGKLNEGFEIPDAGLVVLTEKEIYGKKLYDRKRPFKLKKKSLEELDLKPGDYVVHLTHGIGRYLGIQQLEIGGIRREYLQLAYQGDDKLYVPTDQLGVLQKYVGAEGEVPRLSKLGGSDWTRTKRRVREAVQEMAQELIELYAERQSLKGYAFPPDTPWQAEFEAAFPYQETPDQLTAIAQIKKDMEKDLPMDRLLCGDVGYGKTEVAMRAAFKAVSGGKQVALLVPTTVLAQQHFNTFKERFAGYPVTIEMLSRFRSPREQREIVAGLARGGIDIVIGTHRLVQEDVVFKNLGLVVVDEEQRFGVMQKERLKIRYPNVDVLTLTATPIPRTLYMSLLGIRDTSLLETPPQDRFPVQTYVLEEDPVIIREAINRELSRGGQVYFVHNRVHDLDRVAAWVQRLVPDARVAMAHGQMREDQLEQVMLDFIDGKFDILVCTTIIESGLDIPNVNTLIVKESDQFGLAQLYQLRGRVGRSNRLAYAYLTFRRDKILNEAAEKRLAAIRDFTDFGSGYKLAKKDLEIRGAGSLLGTEQHGNISVVGFEMYCRLLEEAVRELKGEKREEEVDALVELPITAFLPDEYVGDEEQKIRLYHALATVRQKEEVDELAEELRDRFGEHPQPVRNLLAVARIRAAARQLRIKHITRQGLFYRFTFAPTARLDGDRLIALAQSLPNKLRFKEDNGHFEIWLRSAGRAEALESTDEVETFLTALN
ncbi:MAG: transcription-repair coupling factor [Bacillota bacterium]